MMISLIATLVGLAALTAAASWGMRGKTITAPVAVIAFSAIVAVGFTGFWANNRQTDGRTHDACVTRAEGRTDVRAAFTQLYDTLEVAFPATDAQELIVGLRAGLNELLPPLSAADC
jgi:hypothetical protein